MAALSSTSALPTSSPSVLYLENGVQERESTSSSSSYSIFSASAEQVRSLGMRVDELSKWWIFEFESFLIGLSDDASDDQIASHLGVPNKDFIKVDWINSKYTRSNGFVKMRKNCALSSMPNLSFHPDGCISISNYKVAVCFPKTTSAGEATTIIQEFTKEKFNCIREVNTQKSLSPNSPLPEAGVEFWRNKKLTPGLIFLGKLIPLKLIEKVESSTSSLSSLPVPKDKEEKKEDTSTSSSTS